MSEVGFKFAMVRPKISQKNFGLKLDTMYIDWAEGLPKTGRYRGNKFDFIYLIFKCSDD